MNLKIYKSYDEARKAYDIDDNDMYLKITNHPNSLNRIDYGGKIVYCVGKGLMSSQGFPIGNQMYHRQLPFLEKISLNHFIHIFNKIDENTVVHLGLYPLIHFRKVLSFEGFSYFEIKMRRKYQS